ncbi:MAG: hypothetical protein Kow0026_23130 [Oricola sp.]
MPNPATPFRSVLGTIMAVAVCSAVLPVSKASARMLTSTKAGQRCSWPFAPPGVFVGNFLGYEESRFNSDDSVRQFTTQRCFATYRDCDNWLYTMQSAYPVGASPGRCRYKD